MENSSMVPQIFEHKKFGNIRIVVIDGEVWFVAVDVCRALDLSDTSKAVSRLKDREKGTNIVRTLGGPQEMLIVNEPGLYRLVFQSRKPEAEEFQDVVYYEVLPSIRKTGNYIGNPAAVESSIAPTVPQNIHIHTNDFNTEVSANWEKIKTAEALIQIAKTTNNLRAKEKLLQESVKMLTGKDYFAETTLL